MKFVYDVTKTDYEKGINKIIARALRVTFLVAVLLAVVTFGLFICYFCGLEVLVYALLGLGATLMVGGSLIVRFTTIRKRGVATLFGADKTVIRSETDFNDKITHKPYVQKTAVYSFPYTDCKAVYDFGHTIIVYLEKSYFLIPMSSLTEKQIMQLRELLKNKLGDRIIKSK